MLRNKLLFTLFILSGMFIGTGQSLQNVDFTSRDNYAPALADGSSSYIACTKVIINDDCKWNFRDLNIGGFTFDSSGGYDLDDFRNFMGHFYGYDPNFSKESATKGYKWNDDPNNPWFDITSGTGVDGHVSTFYFPYWVQNFTIYIKNNGNDRGFSTLQALNVGGESANGFGRTVTLTISGNDAGTRTYSVSSSYASTNEFGTKTINIKPYSAANTPITSLQEKTIVAPNYNHVDFAYQSYNFDAGYTNAALTSSISDAVNTVAKELPATIYAKYTSYTFNTPDGYLYVKVPAAWVNTAGAVVSIYFYRDGYNDTYWATTKEGHLNYWYDNNVYRIIKPTGTWTHIIVVRLNPSYIDNPGWDGRWNQTQGISLTHANFSSYNTIEVTNEKSWDDWSWVINSNTTWGKSSGSPIYLDLNSSRRSSSGSINNAFIEYGNEMYVYLFDSNISPNYTRTLEFKQILGFDAAHKLDDYDYNMNLFEIVIPEDELYENVQWHKMVIYQGQDPWDDCHKEKWRQTSDILVHPLQNSSNNVYKLTGFTETTLTGAYEWNIPNYSNSGTNDRLYWFITYFVDQTGIVCNASGNTDVDNLKKVWSTNEDSVSSQFLNMCDGAKEAFSDSLDVRSSTLNAMSRYDLIVRKYYREGITDFAGRFSNEQLSLLQANSRNFITSLLSDNDSNIVVVIIASSISLISITTICVLMVRKKKSTLK